jgi:hypothetical protein
MPILRQEEERRKRKTAVRVAGASLVLMIILIGLSIYALVQRNSAEKRRAEAVASQQVAEQRRIEADNQRMRADDERMRADQQRDLAEQRRKVAVARQLAAESVLLSRDRPDLAEAAGLLAVESLKHNPTYEGDQALRSQVRFLPRVTIRMADNIQRIAFSPDGESIAVGQDSGISLISTKTRTRIWTVGVSQSEFKSLTFSSEGRLLGCAGSWGVRVLAANSGAELLRFEQPGYAVAFSSDNVLVAFSSDDRQPGRDVRQRRWLSQGHTDPMGIPHSRWPQPQDQPRIEFREHI